jgi:TM2 domain-containing membrane protein YozV
MYSTGVAYLLWLGCFFLLFGLHRFYLGKPFTGLLWLFTLGLLGVGQLLDLLLIPGMVAQANLRLARFGNQNVNVVNVTVVHRAEPKQRGRDDRDN